MLGGNAYIYLHKGSFIQEKNDFAKRVRGRSEEANVRKEKSERSLAESLRKPKDKSRNSNREFLPESDVFRKYTAIVAGS